LRNLGETKARMIGAWPGGFPHVRRLWYLKK
jgi:hypothetical protein